MNTGIAVVAAAWADTAEPEKLQLMKPDELFYSIKDFEDWLFDKIQTIKEAAHNDLESINYIKGTIRTINIQKQDNSHWQQRSHQAFRLNQIEDFALKH